MLKDQYDLLPFPTKLDKVFQKNRLNLKTHAMAYIPEELLAEMGWSRESRLVITVEKGYLRIDKTEGEIDENYFNLPGELRYEMDEENA